MRIKEILGYFDNAKKLNENSYQVKCPAHKDDKASLTITKDGDKILLYDHAGCSTEDILKAVGLTEKDLFNNQKKNAEVVAEYIYTDENNNPLYKVVRMDPKNFMQAKYNNGEWVWKMTGVRYVPYNLPNVIKSDVVFFVEGEKDADNLNSLGLVATTTVSGASSFNKRAGEYAQYFNDKTVYIIPDNDKAGYKYANNIQEALNVIAKEVKILKLINVIPDLKEKQDISDVIKKYGKEEVIKFINKLKSNTYENKSFPINSIEELNEDTFEKILEYLDIRIKFNTINKRVEIIGMPEKYSKSDLQLVLPIYLKYVLKNNGIKINDIKRIEEFILLETSKRNYNPVLDMLDQNKWDEIDRFEEIFSIFNLKNELDKLKLIKWLKQCVAMLLNKINNPYGAEGILTLVGKQGIGKSRVLSMLSLNPEWFAEGVVLDMNNKDSKILATSRWICELGEVDDTLKKEQSSLKAFITSKEDDIRPPYAKSSIRRARNTSFCATVNRVSFLKDDTGNRRFWVINLEKIDCKKLEKLGYNWILQLWLQVYEEVKKDINCFRLSDDERNSIIQENLQYTEFLPYEEELMDIIEFNPKNKKAWKNKELINKYFPNANSQLLGKALSKIHNNNPDVVEIKRTNRGMTYFMELKEKSANSVDNL